MREVRDFDVRCPNCRGRATLQVVYSPAEALCMNWFACDACDQKEKNVNFRERSFERAAARAMEAFEEMARREQWESPRQVAKRRKEIRSRDVVEVVAVDLDDGRENLSAGLSQRLRNDIDRFYRESLGRGVVAE